MSFHAYTIIFCPKKVGFILGFFLKNHLLHGTDPVMDQDPQLMSSECGFVFGSGSNFLKV